VVSMGRCNTMVESSKLESAEQVSIAGINSSKTKALLRF
jgi:hypothetical protein